MKDKNDSFVYFFDKNKQRIFPRRLDKIIDDAMYLQKGSSHFYSLENKHSVHLSMNKTGYLRIN